MQKPDFSGEWTLNREASALSPVVAPVVRGGFVRAPNLDDLRCVLTRPLERKAGELRKTSEGRLRGIEAETKVFLSVIVVLVRGLMVVRI